jgi:predicted esterase
MGAIIPAVEGRLKAAILWSGGLASGRARPEVDQINFVSRVKIPVLMLNGRHDAIEPYAAAQLSMFRLLGTPEADKRHVVYESGHRLPQNEFVKETLNWLDRYLGPIQ